MQNLEIQFNSAIIKQVHALNFNVDQLGSVLFVLFALYEDRVDLLDHFDDFNTKKRAFLLYKEMEIRELLELADTEDESHFILTKRGIELVEFIKGEFTKSNEEVTSENIAVSGVENLKEAINEDDVESWIDAWVDVFPRGVKSGGRLVRSDRQSCLRKMKIFIKEYGYGRDIIMKATKAYIEAKSNENFAYTRCAVYFIYRVEGSRADKVSDLATWCDQAKHEDSEPKGENNLEIMV